MPAAFCHRAVVAGRRNSAVPVAASWGEGRGASSQAIVTAVSRVLPPDQSRGKELEHVD